MRYVEPGTPGRDLRTSLAGSAPLPAFLGILVAALAAAAFFLPSYPVSSDGPDHAHLLSRMFPDQQFSPVEKEPGGRTAEDPVFRDTGGRTFVIESVRPGSYTGPHETKLLVVVRRPPGEPAHAEGLYQAYLAVFDSAGQEMLTGVNRLTADEGDIHFFAGSDGRSYVFFSGSVTFQGWTEGCGGLWRAASGAPGAGEGLPAAGNTAAEPERPFVWEKVWPADEAFWDDHVVKATRSGLTVLEPRQGRSDPASSSQTAPSSQPTTLSGTLRRPPSSRTAAEPGAAR